MAMVVGQGRPRAVRERQLRALLPGRPHGHPARRKRTWSGSRAGRQTSPWMFSL